MIRHAHQRARRQHWTSNGTGLTLVLARFIEIVLDFAMIRNFGWAYEEIVRNPGR